MAKNITGTVVGCDLGDKHSHVCALEETGTVLERARLTTSPGGLRQWFSERAPCTVVIEVGTHSRWVEQTLKELGYQVCVANARQVGLIYKGKRKNDRIDAEKLARLGRMDKTLLSPIHHRGQDAQKDLVVLRCRDRLVQVRTTLINHVRGMNKSFGIRIASCESNTFPRRAREAVPASLLGAVESVLCSIEELNKQIKSYEKTIETMAKECPEAQGVLTIDGVGALTAMAYILTLEAPERFERSRDVGAFLGLVPREWQTGESAPQLRITKAGDAFVRKLLVNCAHYILGRYGKDSDMRRFGQRIMQRGGKTAKKKAVIAVARKLAVLMHRLWVTGKTYEPLRNQPQMAAAA